MSVQRDPDAILAAWLEEGPSVLPEATRRAIAVNTRTNRQTRRPTWLPWRTPSMTVLARMAVAAIAIVVAFGGAAYLFAPRENQAAPPPSPAASTSPSSALFRSPLYAYSVQVPPNWTVTPATVPWPGGFQLEEDPADADSFLLEGSPGGASISIKAHAIPTGMTAAAWLADWERLFEVGGHCFGSAGPWTDASVAGIPARRLQWRCDSATDAKSNYDVYSLVSGGTGYVISGTPSMVDVAVQSFQVQ